MKTLPIAGSLTFLASLGCVTRTERVAVVEHASAPSPPPRQAAPQVMIAPHVDANGQQVALGEMTEARRRELLLPKSNPIEPYTPAPPPAPPGDETQSYAHPASGPEPDYRHPNGYDVLADVARVGLFTAAGAIIGHQFDDKGKGVAIGGGLALLTTPWLWGGNWYR